MPFLHADKGKLSASLKGLEAFEDSETVAFLFDPLPDRTPSMERRTQRLNQELLSGTRNIGSMLQWQPQIKMAVTVELETMPTGAGVTQPDQASEQVPHPAGDTEGSAPVIQRDFRNLVTEIKGLLAADVVVIKADLQSVMDRETESEGDITDLKMGLSSLIDTTS
ncbi:Hypothetical predicted protein [Pelobates cultripes]|uniref:Uncharacterized protein n=1 Tax=Pelobates cultripes TaxID=61616 RepID=A0AAD1TIJ2_PELCU|nr:Hypothetical predicted protein [Pelobates cultripes]